MVPTLALYISARQMHLHGHTYLLVPGVFLMSWMNLSMMGLLTASRCVTSQGPSVTPILAVRVVLSTRPSFSRTSNLGSALSRNSMGKLSPKWTSGT